MAQMSVVRGGPRLRRLTRTLPERALRLILCNLDIRSRTRMELVSNEWKKIIEEINTEEHRPVWVYMIFRKGHLSGHERLTVNVSYDGPIFWEKLIIYVYCCSCHFNANHEVPVLGLFKRLSHRVNRLCLVDNPIDFPFLSDSFFKNVADNFSNLQFIYLRQIDLQNLNYNTVLQMAAHPTIKKVVVHGCRKYDVMQDFSPLPQLLVVKGEIQGLKVLLGDIATEDTGQWTENGTMENGPSTAEESDK